MDSLAYNQQVFILNGQPVIIQRNTGVNNINSDILQHALQDTSPTSADNVVSAQIDTSDHFMQSVQDSGEDNCTSEYVAYVGNNEDDSSTIHLTVEQAAELGLQFDVDDCKLDDEVGTGDGEINKGEDDQYIFAKPADESDCLYNATAEISTDFQQNHNNEQSNAVITNQKGFEPTIEPMAGSISDTSNHQLTLIPHFLNGTVTYTLQMNNTNTSDTSQLKNNLSTVSKSSNNITSAVTENDYSISNLASSSAVLSSLIQSSLATNSQVMSTSSNQAPTTNLITTTNVNVPASNTSKLTYILPDTMVLNTQPNNITPKTVSNSITGYQHASLPQIIESVRRQRLVNTSTNNGFAKSRSILKGSNPVINRDATGTVLVPNPSSVTLPATITVSEMSQVGGATSKQKTNVTLVCDNIGTQTSVHSKENNPGFKIENIRPNTYKSSVAEKLPILKPITPEDTNDLPKEVSKALSLLPMSANVKKPLGSSENPIQLVQQGQTFTSFQSLTDDQMKQVTTVLQQKNFNLTTPAKNVLYDAETNTRIIYRVVHPEELDLTEANGGTDGINRGKKRGRPLKNKPTDSMGQTSQEETPRRRQPLPRTRSGRLSRPPRHMVRDYKRIRRLDMDDSDGAYSDYQSDHEEDTNSKNLLPGLSMPQKRNFSSTFRCPSCNKIYLGYRRMSRHFDKNPDHGSQEYLLQLKKPSRTSKQLFNIPLEAADDMGAQSDVGGGGAIGKGRGIGRRKGRKRVGTMPPDRMRTRLKELLELCDESELVEVAGPAVASVLSSWELLLLRVEATSEQARVTTLCDEIKSLLDRVREIGCNLFQPLDNLVETQNNITFEMKDEVVSSVFGIPCGVYKVEESLLKTDKVSAKRLKVNDTGLDAVKDTLLDKLGSEHPQVLPDLDKTVVGVNDISATKERETSVQFLLPGEEMLCDERSGLDSVDQIVSERLQNFTSAQNQELCKSAVDELIFNALERNSSIVRNRPDLEPPDELMVGFSITDRRAHVSASTEDLIKSLENFSSDLQTEDRQGFTPSDNFNRVNVTNVDTLDFEVLSQDFHSGSVNQQ